MQKGREATLTASSMLSKHAVLDAELQSLRAQVAAAKQANAQVPDTHDYSEAETRKAFIDVLLREAGWVLDPAKNFEVEVEGMPNGEGRGFVDYVLWGDDGKPLMLVEAKRTTKNPAVGQQQAKLYADCLEQKYGQRPVIFYSNGYEHWIWDDLSYPPRAVQGFYKKDELQLLVQRRSSRKALADATARAQSLEWLYRIRQLEGELRELGAKRHTPIPNTLDGFEDWCKEQLVGAVEVVNRAVQAVRKSEFHDPEFIYKCLVLLRDAYVPMRVEGSKERREAYEKALQELQLEESPTGDGIKYAADQYSVVYGGARRPLDRHLKGSNSRDRRYGFRLYFFWDEEGEVVVVGWLPSHLDNRLT